MAAVVLLAGCAGAQPAEVFTRALEQAWADRGPLQVVAAGDGGPGESGGAVCADGSDLKIVWTQEAEERLGKIPQFARSMAKQGIERHAREKGYREISDAVMEEVRDQFAM